MNAPRNMSYVEDRNVLGQCLSAFNPVSDCFLSNSSTLRSKEENVLSLDNTMTDNFQLELINFPDLNSNFSETQNRMMEKYSETSHTGIGSICPALIPSQPKSFFTDESEKSATKEDIKNEEQSKINFTDVRPDREMSDMLNVYRHAEQSGIGCTGTDIKKIRRREFHKIHTRRSRAKLNERMERLRRTLPAPPSGVVVKSKAQIIDYAIVVIKSLMKDISSCSLSQVENRILGW